MRLLLALAALLGVAGAVHAPAAPPTVRLSRPPSTLLVGAAWNATLTFRVVPARAPKVVARLGARTLVFRGRASARRGSYRLRLAFPAAGRWRLTWTGRLLATVVVKARPPREPPLPGVTATVLCGNPQAPYPQYALAAAGDELWLACHDARTLVRVDPATGGATRRLSLQVNPWAIAAGFGAVWVVDRDSPSLKRVDPVSGRVLANVALPGLPVYLWAAAGSVWVGLEAGTTLVRVDPASNAVSALLDVGDGASALVSDGNRVWVACHRENALVRIDVRTNDVTRLRSQLAEGNVATDRMLLAGDSLWITGRGLDLIRVDPETGATRATIEIGAAGIDLTADARGIWVAAYTAAAEPRGDPVLESLRLVDPGTNAVTRTLVATSPARIVGIAATQQAVWLAAGGTLVRVP